MTDHSGPSAEIERLSACLAKANANHEKFERLWYLTQDEREAARQALRACMADCVEVTAECDALRVEISELKRLAKCDALRMEEMKRNAKRDVPACIECCVTLGDSWCGECAGRAARERHAEALLECARWKLRHAEGCVELSAAHETIAAMQAGSAKLIGELMEIRRRVPDVAVEAARHKLEHEHRVALAEITDRRNHAVRLEAVVAAAQVCRFNESKEYLLALWAAVDALVTKETDHGR